MFRTWLAQWTRPWVSHWPRLWRWPWPWPWPRSLGTRGERLAARYLRRQGYRLLARNVRNRYGEIDLVAETPDHRTLVIVEVKTGTGGGIQPEVHVNRTKQRKLVNLATQLIRRHRLQDRPVRFDVIGIDLHSPITSHPLTPHHITPHAKPTIRHHPGAFQASSRVR